MPIITLTTDLGINDYYLGAVKGAILSKCKDPIIVDISNEIEPFNIVNAAFVLKNAYRNFPEGTIHIVNVNALDSKDTKYLMIQQDDHHFIGTDNGVFSLMWEEMPREIFEIFRGHGNANGKFPGKDIMVGAAGDLTNGKGLETIGKPISNIQQRTAIQPVITENFIRGTVIYVDYYENVIVNIKKNVFEEARKDRRYTLYYRGNDSIAQISENYYDVPEGEPLFFFNASEYLEIAMNKAKAASLLGIRPGDTIQIDFE